MYAYLSGEKEYAALAGKMEKIVYGPMFIRGGRLDGMVRWCTNSWNVCYQDDVARAILPGLYDSLFMKNDRRMAERCCLDCMMLCIWEIVLMWKISVAQWIF